MPMVEEGSGSTGHRDVVDVHTGGRLQPIAQGVWVSCAYCGVGQGDDGDTVVFCKNCIFY